MNLVLVNGPVLEPVTLDDVRRYLRLDSDAEDALVTAMIRAGRMTVEAATNVALLEQTWRLRLDVWPASGFVAVPIGPLRRVEAARIRLADGGTIGLDIAAIRVESGVGTVVVTERPVAPPGGFIEIDVCVGYGAGPEDVPEPLRLAVRTLVARWFDDRGETPAPRGAPLLPDAVRALIAPFRSLRLA